MLIFLAKCEKLPLRANIPASVFPPQNYLARVIVFSKKGKKKKNALNGDTEKACRDIIASL